MPAYLIALLCLVLFLLLLVLLALLAIRPNRRRRATALYTSYNYAHRGLHDEHLPENSLAAFEAACRAGYGIELDVRLSRDGIPVVFHDDTLRRVCNRDGMVSDYTAEQLSAMPLEGKSAHTIPTLRAVLDTVDGRVPLIVEIKAGRDADPVCSAAMALLDHYTGAFCIESFSPYAVRWFRRNRPLLVRGQLSDCFHREKGHRSLPFLLVESLCTNFLTRPDFIAFRHSCPRHLPLRIATRLYGAASFAWTPRGDDQILNALAFFDAVIFENGNPPERNASHETESGRHLPFRS